MRKTPFAAVALVLSYMMTACGSDTSPSTVLPNYAGVWRVNVVYGSCTQSGTIAQINPCSGVNGSTDQYTMNLTQTGTAPGATLSGTFSVDNLLFAIATAAIANNGSVTFTGTNLSQGVTAAVTWSLTSPVAGTVTVVITATGLSGSANFTGTIVNASKTGSAGVAPLGLSHPLRDAAHAVADR